MRNGKHHEADGRDFSHLSVNGQKAPTVRQTIEARTERKRRDRRLQGSAFTKRMRELAQLPQGTQYQRITAEMMQSPAWLALMMNPNAMAVVWRLIAEHLSHGGTANGELICTYDDFARYGIRRQSVMEAITIAEQLGFITVIRGKRAEFGRDRLPSIYALTFEPRADGSPRTDRWASDECTMHARSLLQARHRVYAKRPQQGAFNRD
jgi:hypothetical protein